MLNTLKRLFCNIFQKRRIEQDLNDEIRTHLDLLIDENIQLGMGLQAATRAARLELGSVELLREKVRLVRVGQWIDTLGQDLRFGARQLQKNPLFTVAAVLTLALGVGASTSMFAVVDAILLRPLPYPHSGRIVRVGSTWKGSPYSGAVIAGPHYQFLRQYSQSFEFVEAHDVVTSGVNVSGRGEPQHLVTSAVSPDFFDVLGIVPALGWGFSKQEDHPGSGCETILTNALWQERYAGNRSIVGQSLVLNGQSCLITGILPPDFTFDQNPDLFTSVSSPPATRDPGHYYIMLARLKPGVTLAQARAEMRSLFSRFKAANGDLVDQDETGFALTTYLDSIVGNLEPSLWLLFGAVSLLLLIACANVASLLLSRTVARKSEMAIRTAVGAGRRRLVRQLVTEGTLLASAGGGVGLLVARWGILGLRSIAPSSLPRMHDVSLDLPVAGFAVLLSALALLLFSLAPAFRASALNVNVSLQSAAGGTGTDISRAHARSLLIGAEVALSVVLLSGAVLLVRSFIALRGVAPGFDANRVLTFKMSPSPRYSSTPLLWGFENQLLQRIDALPGVDTAAVAICLPLERGPDMPSEILGQSQPTTFNPHYRSVSSDYFKALRIPMVRGRPFNDSDTPNSIPVVIINKSLAQSFFKGRDPLGAYLRLGVGLGPNYAEPPRIIVGVAGDVRESSLDQPSDWTVFIPRSQVPTALTADINRLVGASWAVKTKIPPSELAATVRQTILKVDPEQPISAVRTMESTVSAATERQRFLVLLMNLFAALGVVLTAVGSYGLISCVVAQRTHEIGIRMALGAGRRDVLKVVILGGMQPALVGAIAGIIAALVLSRFLATELYGVSPRDPVTLAEVAVGVMAVTFGASYVPARRATRVDPMVALRHE